MKAKDCFKILGFLKDARFYKRKITQKDTIRKYFEKKQENENTVRKLYRQEMSINEFKQRRLIAYKRMEEMKLQLDDAISKAKRLDIIALRNAIIHISKLSKSYNIDALKEQMDYTEKRYNDFHVYERNIKDNNIVSTDYLKMVKMADIDIDFVNNDILNTPDKTLSKYMISLPLGDKKGYTYKFYCDNLNEEKIKDDLEYQKAIIQAIEQSWQEKRYSYCYIGEVERQESGNYIIKKSEVKEQIADLSEEVLRKRYYEKMMNEKGER